MYFLHFSNNVNVIKKYLLVSKVRAAMARRTQVHSVEITDNTEELESPITIETGSLAIKDDSNKEPQKGKSI